MSLRTLFLHQVGARLSLPVPDGTLLTGLRLVMELRKPDGSNLPMVPALTPATGDKTIWCVTRKGDLSLPGIYNLSARIPNAANTTTALPPGGFPVWERTQAGTETPGAS